MTNAAYLFSEARASGQGAMMVAAMALSPRERRPSPSCRYSPVVDRVFARQKALRPSRANIWRLFTFTRVCTAGRQPKPTCKNIFASVHLQCTRWCSHSNAQASSDDSRASLAASKCSLIRNACQSYFDLAGGDSSHAALASSLGRSWPHPFQYSVHSSKRPGTPSGCRGIRHGAQ